MTKNVPVAILILLLLSACLTITKNPDIPAPRQAFVTATPAPTSIRWLPATATISPETTTPAVAITAPANCTNIAILLRDVTIPDHAQVTARETFTKTWEFQNTGTCPWVGYTIKFSTGDSMNGPLSALVANTLPGEKVQVSVDLTAPSTEGAYTAFFTLNDPGGNTIPVGSEKSFWVKVLVGNVILAQNTKIPAINTGANPNCAYSENAGYVSELISMINQARADANIPALAVDPQLSQAAQDHSVYMACNNFLGHFGSDGAGWWIRASRAGYSSPSVAEIIAIGTPQDAMSQWRSDAGHWEFVMNAATEIGVGYAYYSQSDFGGYITVDFGG